jgi:hypothetical protein
VAGSLTVPFDVLVVEPLGVFFEVSLCVVLD